MTEVGTSLTDLTREDNVVQARFELDRAMQSSGYAQLSSWAAMIEHTADLSSQAVRGSVRERPDYNPQKLMELPQWL